MSQNGSEKSEKIHNLFADVTWFGILLSEAMTFRFFLEVSKSVQILLGASVCKKKNFFFFFARLLE